jgi:PBSX family phage terminase large subunit
MPTVATTPNVKLLFEPVNDGQRGFIASAASRLLFSGAFGAGKSVVLCAKALKLSLDYPGNFGFIARKVRASLSQTTLKTFLELVCPKELISDHNKSEGLVRLTNGSEILFGGLDDYLKLGSLNLGFAGIDEAIESIEDDWKMLEGRLRKPNVPHIIFAATNPGPPTHYLYKMFFQDKRGEVYQASSFDNKALPKDYLERLSEFDGVYYDRFVLGLWKGLEGLVYSSFDDRTCLIPRFEIDKKWLVYAGHDFGDANPAAIFYAESPGTGDFYAFAEYLPGAAGRSIYDHVQEFKKITEGYNVIKRAGGNHTTEGQIREGYTQQGWHITEPKHSQAKRYQIQKVQGMHRLNKIYIFNDLKNYIKEKFSFAYEKKDGVLTEQIAHEERFHLMSAERGILSDFTPETVVSRKREVSFSYF